MSKPKTSDFKEPPVKSTVATFNNPGVRYFIDRIDGSGTVFGTEWVACSRWQDTYQTRAWSRVEWARLMDRWVLVRPPGGINRFSTTSFKHYVDKYSNVSEEDFVRRMMLLLESGQARMLPPIEWVPRLHGVLTSSPIFEEPVQSPHGIPCDGATGTGGERQVPGQAPQGDA